MARRCERTLARVRGAHPDATVRLHGMRLPLGALLVVRAFELWTHENDIRAQPDCRGACRTPRRWG